MSNIGQHTRTSAFPPGNPFPGKIRVDSTPPPINIISHFRAAHALFRHAAQPCGFTAAPRKSQNPLCTSCGSTSTRVGGAVASCDSNSRPFRNTAATCGTSFQSFPNAFASCESVSRPTDGAVASRNDAAQGFYAIFATCEKNRDTFNPY